MNINGINKSIKLAANEMFDFAKKHNFINPNGMINEDGLILVHLDKFVPRNGYIDTARSAVGATRDSVHFCVNHAVVPHENGNWADYPFAVLMPMKTALKNNENVFVGGTATDFYSRGKVKIPKGSVIVRRIDDIAKGNYRITDASKIDEFKMLKGVKVIDTSAENIQECVDGIIPKLGYRLKTTDNPWVWGDNGKLGIDWFRQFNSFLISKGMKPMMHTYTPNAKIEMLIEHIRLRSDNGKGWQVLDKNGNIIIDYKKEYTEILKYIDEYAAKYNFPKDFHTKELSEIISSSETPEHALTLIKNNLGLSPMREFSYNPTELEFLQSSRGMVGGHKSCQLYDKTVCDYVANPSIKNYNKVLFPTVGYETIPNSQLENWFNSIKTRMINILKKHGIDTDNTVANKLDKLA